MERFIRIKGHPNMVKDLSSKAVLNTDLTAAARHMEKLQKVKRQLQQNEEVQNLKTEVGEIKSTLKTILGLLQQTK